MDLCPKMIFLKRKGKKVGELTGKCCISSNLLTLLENYLRTCCKKIFMVFTQGEVVLTWALSECHQQIKCTLIVNFTSHKSFLFKSLKWNTCKHMNTVKTKKRSVSWDQAAKMTWHYNEIYYKSYNIDLSKTKQTHSLTI